MKNLRIKDFTPYKTQSGIYLINYNDKKLGGHDIIGTHGKPRFSTKKEAEEAIRNYVNKYNLLKWIKEGKQ